MTATEHAHFAEWDAAYVLGALSPAERREFDEHREECERCRDAVADLSALPGLLGRLDDARAFALLEDEPGEAPEPRTAQGSTEDLVARIQNLDRRRRIRRIAGGVGALAAAAALASVLTLAIPAALTPTPAPDVVAAFAPAGQQAIPLTVAVDLTRTPWGTRLTMDCVYPPAAATADGYGPATYSLWVVGTDGSEESVSTWKSWPGSEVRLDAATATTLDDIAQLDLRSGDGSRVLMTSRLAS